MSTFPNFSEIPPFVQKELNKRKSDMKYVSSLSPWIRVTSAVKNKQSEGLVVESNLAYTKDPYGTQSSGAAMGKNWTGKLINISGDGGIYKPRPSVSSIEIDEGAGELSRKATVSFTAYTTNQLEMICNYFLEPGYSIFIEWGWNNTDVRATNGKIEVKDISKFQSIEEVNKLRATSDGSYDNYLGFITGGDISVDGDKWTITVKCSGFTELASYLRPADNNAISTDSSSEALDYSFTESEISSMKLVNVTKAHYMIAYNKFPSTLKTAKIREYIQNEVTDSVDTTFANFINVNKTAQDKVNDTSDGLSFFGLFTLNKADYKVTNSDQKLTLPTGTKLVDDDSFIRFGTLMKFINMTTFESYKIGTTDVVKSTIDTSDSIVGGFPNMFSLNKNLFIPCSQTPNFGKILLNISQNKPVKFDKSDTVSNSVYISNGATIHEFTFPHTSKIENSKITSPIQNGKDADIILNSITIDRSANPKFKVDPVNIEAGYWGFLDDLYVNIDFVKGILETRYLTLKDAMYQILNGMSSAAGGIWDFQLVETTTGKDKVSRLKVVDLNIASSAKGDGIYKFDIKGKDSIFIDVNFNIDMSGAMMNNIIGKRIADQSNINNTVGKIGTLFGNNSSDMILQQITQTADTIRKNEEAKARVQMTPEEIENAKKEAEKQKEAAAKSAEESKAKNMETFLQSAGIYPKVTNYGDYNASTVLDDSVYIGYYDNSTFFDDVKTKSMSLDETTDAVGILLPIKFSFTIHGVSGIIRGSKFNVYGIPSMYQNRGFFQVTGVKHTISGMKWITEVEGGFRSKVTKSKK